MKPCVYRRSAIVIAVCGPMPRPALAARINSTVFNANGRGFTWSFSLTLSTLQKQTDSRWNSFGFHFRAIFVWSSFCSRFTYCASRCRFTRFMKTFATSLLNIRFRCHSNVTSGLPTLICTYQNASGLKFWISSWRCTQNPSVGVWHGPYEINDESKSP